MGDRNEAYVGISREEFENVAQKWPHNKQMVDQLTEEDVACLEKVRKVWPIAMEYLDNTHIDEDEKKDEGEDKHEEDKREKIVWRKERLDFIPARKKFQMFCTMSDKLDAKVYKIVFEMEWNWEIVLDLLRSTNTAVWNKSLDRENIVAILPQPAERNEGAAWIAYTRMSDSVSKFISKTDFCTCFEFELLQDRVIYIGTACETSLCPHRNTFPRGEKKMLGLEVRKVTDKRCMVTQVAAVDFKKRSTSTMMVSIIDTQMIRSLAKDSYSFWEYAKDTIKEEEDEELKRIEREHAMKRFKSYKNFFI